LKLPPYPTLDESKEHGNDVKEMDVSSLNFTQGSLTYCENKVKSKSKIVIYKHESVTIYKVK
jgi:hypothetical protein